MAVTREQVVQWAWQAHKTAYPECDISLKEMEGCKSDGTVTYYETFSTLARADLEATIAEQAKQLEEMAEAIRGKDEALVRIAGDGQCPNYWWEIYARDAIAIQPSSEILAVRDQRIVEACCKVVDAHYDECEPWIDSDMMRREWRNFL